MPCVSLIEPRALLLLFWSGNRVFLCYITFYNFKQLLVIVHHILNSILFQELWVLLINGPRKKHITFFTSSSLLFVFFLQSWICMLNNMPVIRSRMNFWQHVYNYMEGVVRILKKVGGRVYSDRIVLLMNRDT